MPAKSRKSLLWSSFSASWPLMVLHWCCALFRVRLSCQFVKLKKQRLFTTEKLQFYKVWSLFKKQYSSILLFFKFSWLYACRLIYWKAKIAYSYHLECVVVLRYGLFHLTFYAPFLRNTHAFKIILTSWECLLHESVYQCQVHQLVQVLCFKFKSVAENMTGGEGLEVKAWLSETELG